MADKMQRRLITAAICGVLFLGLIATSSATGPADFSDGNTRMAANVTVAPGLPADRFEEGAMSFAARVTTADGSRPPALRRFLLDANPNLRFDFKGIGTCRAAQKPGSRLELPGCRSALVGTGSVNPEYDVQARQPVCCDGSVLIYNGGLVDGNRRLWLRFNVSVPEPAIVVDPIDVKQVSTRAYRRAAVLSPRSRCV